MLLITYRNEALFLNVDGSSEEKWGFLPRSQIMFNVPDIADPQEPRVFLAPLLRRLFATGAFEFQLVEEPNLYLSPPEEELNDLRAAFDGMRATSNSPKRVSCSAP